MTLRNPTELVNIQEEAALLFPKVESCKSTMLSFIAVLKRDIMPAGVYDTIK